MKEVRNRIFSKEKWRDESGATAVEYGLLVGLIAVFLITTMSFIGGSIGNTFEKAGCLIQGKTYTAGNPSATPPTVGTCAP